MRKSIKTWMMVIVAIFMIQACSKEEGVVKGKEIKGTVMYTDGVADGAVVYITYGATESTGEYNASTVANANGAYSIQGLNPGDYFIDAVYTDDNGIEFNTPGYYVEIGSAKGTLDLNIDLK